MGRASVIAGKLIRRFLAKCLLVRAAGVKEGFSTGIGEKINVM